MRATLSNANKFLTITVAAGALLVGAGLGTAQAVTDAKNYPGAMCRPLSSSSSAHVSYERNGSIANRSEQFRVEVLCPVIRDRPRGDGLSYVVASFGGPHEPRFFGCSLYVRRPLDNKFQELTTMTAKRNAYTGTMISSIRGMRTDVSNFYMLNCWLPAKRKGTPPPMLHSYSVHELTED